MGNLQASLENCLREVETCHAGQMGQLNRTLLHLESEPAQTQAEGQAPGPGVQALLNIKVKLKAEIATYHHLVEEGEDFNLGDALDHSHSLQSMQKTNTCRTVDGKVVSEVSATKILRC